MYTTHPITKLTTLKPVILLLIAHLLSKTLLSQDVGLTLQKKFLSQASDKINDLRTKLEKKMRHSLFEMRVLERKTSHKLKKDEHLEAIDSTLNEEYKKFESKLKSLSVKVHNPYLDSLKCTLKFFTETKNRRIETTEFSEKVSYTLESITQLEQSLAKVEALKFFLAERRSLLKQRLENLNQKLNLVKIDKHLYYYSVQVEGFKNILSDPKHIEKKVIEILKNDERFKKFIKENSFLASVFGVPDLSNPISTQTVYNLQSRVAIDQFITQRTGNTQFFQQVTSVNPSNVSLSDVKVSLNKKSGEVDTDFQKFKPNNQKTKSFLKRLEYSTNFQVQKAKYNFPITSDFGLSIGYKLNDNFSIGVGGSYKVGWGTAWDDISITHQGLGLRSYFEHNLKGSISIVGGYEQNYRSLFNSYNALKDYDAWQKSGLLGVAKKYKLSKKSKAPFNYYGTF